MESFQNSTPVIAYDHGGSSEMIQHGVNGALVTPLDTSKMTEEILYLIDNPSKVQELGEAAFLRYQEAFSLPAFLLNIEKEILGLS
ncbi:glycosyltransferase [Halopseudomonas pachastrellae]|nr:glycosyltransferase [Halopseudomonas pachastrellae]